MKNKILAVFVVIFSFILQTTVCRYIAFGNVGPNLLIISTASFGFMMGQKAGITVGFFIGLLADIFSGGILGFHALLYMYIGYFNGFFKRLFFKDDLMLQILLVGCSDFVYSITYYLLMFLLRGKFHIGYYLMNIIIPEVVYTILLTIVLFFVMTFINRVAEKRANRSSEEIV